MKKNENKKIDIVNIQQELSKYTKETNELISSIIDIVQEKQLYNQSAFEYFYQKYKEVEFIYNFHEKPLCIKDLYNGENDVKLDNCNEDYNITSVFYEGFGYDTL